MGWGMKQLTLAAVGFERYARTTRRAVFLTEMEGVVPWSALCALIEPFYPKPGNGRPPVGVERMLRLYFLQQWFNFSDPAVEEALYDSLAMRRFVGPTRPRYAGSAICSTARSGPSAVGRSAAAPRSQGTEDCEGYDPRFRAGLSGESPWTIFPRIRQKFLAERHPFLSSPTAGRGRGQGEGGRRPVSRRRPPHPPAPRAPPSPP